MIATDATLVLSFGIKVIIRSLGLSIAVKLVLGIFNLQYIFGFFSPYLFEIALDSFFEAEGTEPDEFSSRYDTVLLKDVCLYDEKQFPDEHSKVLAVLCPLDVCDYSLIGSASHLLIEECDVTVIEENRLSCVLTSETKCSSNRKFVCIPINEGRHEFGLELCLKLGRSPFFPAGKKALLR